MCIRDSYSEAIEAGIVWVNMHTFLDPAVPFEMCIRDSDKADWQAF